MLSILTIAALATGVPFQAQTLDGKSVVGELSSLDSTQVVLQTDSGEVALPLSQLAALQPRERPGDPPASAKIAVSLRDGSLLPLTEYLVTSGTALVRTPADRQSRIATRNIHSVRFDSDPKLDKQWSEIAQAEAAGDRLIVRKEDSLDFLEGVVRDLDAETCNFELDGEVIPVKLPKVAGIVYANTATAELPAPIGQLVAVDGARLELRSIELSQDQLKVHTAAGTKHELLLADVDRLDFSLGKIVFLSDLEPERVTFTPLLGFEQPPGSLLGFYEYRRDTGFEQSPLKVGDQVFQKGLALATRTELVYRLPDRFRQFSATVGIDDSTRETGSVQLVIRGDGKVLWQGEIKGTNPPQELALPIAGVRRLEILADYGQGLDVGDRLDVCNAQVTK